MPAQLEQDPERLAAERVRTTTTVAPAPAPAPASVTTSIPSPVPAPSYPSDVGLKSLSQSTVYKPPAPAPTPAPKPVSAPAPTPYSGDVGLKTVTQSTVYNPPKPATAPAPPPKPPAPAPVEDVALKNLSQSTVYNPPKPAPAPTPAPVEDMALKNMSTSTVYNPPKPATPAVEDVALKSLVQSSVYNPPKPAPATPDVGLKSLSQSTVYNPPKPAPIDAPLRNLVSNQIYNPPRQAEDVGLKAVVQSPVYNPEPVPMARTETFRGAPVQPVTQPSLEAVTNPVLPSTKNILDPMNYAPQFTLNDLDPLERAQFEATPGSAKYWAGVDPEEFTKNIEAATPVASGILLVGGIFAAPLFLPISAAAMATSTVLGVGISEGMSYAITGKFLEPDQVMPVALQSMGLTLLGVGTLAGVAKVAPSIAGHILGRAGVNAALGAGTSYVTSGGDLGETAKGAVLGAGMSIGSEIIRVQSPSFGEESGYSGKILTVNIPGREPIILGGVIKGPEGWTAGFGTPSVTPSAYLPTEVLKSANPFSENPKSPFASQADVKIFQKALERSGAPSLETETFAGGKELIYAAQRTRATDLPEQLEIETARDPFIGEAAAQVLKSPEYAGKAELYGSSAFHTEFPEFRLGADVDVQRLPTEAVAKDFAAAIAAKANELAGQKLYGVQGMNVVKLGEGGGRLTDIHVLDEVPLQGSSGSSSTFGLPEKSPVNIEGVKVVNPSTEIVMKGSSVLTPREFSATLTPSQKLYLGEQAPGLLDYIQRAAGEPFVGTSPAAYRGKDVTDFLAMSEIYNEQYWGGSRTDLIGKLTELYAEKGLTTRSAVEAAAGAMDFEVMAPPQEFGQQLPSGGGPAKAAPIPMPYLPPSSLGLSPASGGIRVPGPGIPFSAPPSRAPSPAPAADVALKSLSRSTVYNSPVKAVVPSPVPVSAPASVPRSSMTSILSPKQGIISIPSFPSMETVTPASVPSKPAAPKSPAMSIPRIPPMLDISSGSVSTPRSRASIPQVSPFFIPDSSIISPRTSPKSSSWSPTSTPTPTPRPNVKVSGPGTFKPPSWVTPKTPSGPSTRYTPKQPTSKSSPPYSPFSPRPSPNPTPRLTFPEESPHYKANKERYFGGWFPRRHPVISPEEMWDLRGSKQRRAK